MSRRSPERTEINRRVIRDILTKNPRFFHELYVETKHKRPKRNHSINEHHRAQLRARGMPCG